MGNTNAKKVEESVVVNEPTAEENATLNATKEEKKQMDLCLRSKKKVERNNINTIL